MMEEQREQAMALMERLGPAGIAFASGGQAVSG